MFVKYISGISPQFVVVVDHVPFDFINCSRYVTNEVEA